MSRSPACRPSRGGRPFCVFNSEERHLAREHPRVPAHAPAAGQRAIICTNIPDTGITGVPGRHHPQYIDVAHREHAVVETVGARTGKAPGSGPAVSSFASHLCQLHPLASAPSVSRLIPGKFGNSGLAGKGTVTSK
jgi:hypothetical protein